MPAEFANLLEKLSDGGVRYLIVGGVAVGLNGFPRFTNDLDLIIEGEPENVRRLLSVLSAWGEGSARELELTDFLPAELGSIRIVEDFALDVFTAMRARGEERVWNFADLFVDARVHVSAKGTRIGFISLARLIALKDGTGREKDRVDSEVLREIQNAGREAEPVALEAIGPRPSLGDAMGEPSGEEPPEEEWHL